MANLPLPILFPSSVLIILIFLCILRRMVLGGVGGMHQIFSIVKLLQGSLCGEVSSCLNVRVFLFSFLIFFLSQVTFLSHCSLAESHSPMHTEGYCLLDNDLGAGEDVCVQS